MPKINVLDSTVYNKISAGEVVERPASVVKELVENSLDAGAKNITIELVNGGIDLIKVQDDGIGIEQADVLNAFLPHATSKIAKADDLANIQTMGFRGEALSSIASVSQVELFSKTDEEELGTHIELQGGEVRKKELLSLGRGTTINISNLFYNVPARKKFLKKPKLEENAVTDIISRIILTHPEISISYIADGKTIYSSSGYDLEDSLFTIYGKTILDNIIKVDYKKNNIEISGFIGKAIFAKPNRTYQTLSINHRFIQNSNVSFAVQRGYENYLMKGKFPFFVLNINIPNDCVDVNVHPQKMEVRLENDGEVFSAVYHCVQDELIKNRELATFTDFSGQFKSAFGNTTENDDSRYDADLSNITITNQNQTVNCEKPIFDNNSNATSINSNISYKFENKEEQVNNEIQNKQNNQNSLLNKFQNVELDNFEKSNKYNTQSTNNGMLSFNSSFGMSAKRENNIQQIQEYKKVETEQNTFLEKAHKVLSTLFNTYILIEQEENFIIIDQHAAHERVLFEELKEKIQNKTFSSHSLLTPYVFDVSPQENETLQSLMKELNELGFEIEEFGNLSYKISAIPFDDYVSFDGKKFIDDILKTNYKSSNLKENFKDFLATRACKAAVKGGDKLSSEEIEYLISEVIENDTPMFCPHGRPIAIKFTKKDVEKWFKRIV